MAGDVYQTSNADGDAIAKFFLSILWRASISARPLFSQFSIEPYEDLARDILFGARSLSEMPQYQLLGTVYRSDQFDVGQFYMAPYRAKFEQLSAYVMPICGLQMIAKIDERPLPSNWNAYTINGSRTFRLSIERFEETKAYKSIVEMISAHEKM